MDALTPTPPQAALASKTWIGSSVAGFVYQAIYQGKAVAVKVYQQRVKDDWLDLRKEYEFMSNAKLGVCKEKKRPFLIMELARSLRDLFEKKVHLSANRRLAIAFSVARKLKSLHSQSIVHRNLTSSNVMIRSDWSVFLMDFGPILKGGLPRSSTDLDCWINSTRKNTRIPDRTTSLENIEKKSHPIAPEIQNGDDSLITCVADIYGFGTILFDLLTPDFNGDSECLKLIQKCRSSEVNNRPTLDELLLLIYRLRQSIFTMKNLHPLPEDISDIHIIGSNARSLVYLATYDEEKVAVKYYQQPNEMKEPLDNVQEAKYLENGDDKLYRKERIKEYQALHATVFHAGLDSMVMERSNSLQSLLLDKEADLRWDRRLALAYDISFQLEGLHSQNVVHGNLKSSNVMIRSDNSLFLVDFDPNKKSTLQKSTDVIAFGEILCELMARQSPCPEALKLKPMPNLLENPLVCDEYLKLVQSCSNQEEKRLTIDAISNALRRLLRCYYNEDDLSPEFSKMDLKPRFLGKGATCRVYAARYKGQPVAVKFLVSEKEQNWIDEVTKTLDILPTSVRTMILKYSGSDEAAKQKTLEHESHLLTRLSHPNIANILGFETKTLKIILERAGRGSLYDILHKSTQKLDWLCKLRVALGIAQGIDYLHSRNCPIMHRDLKSPNIMIRYDWTPFIIDFGVAKENKEEDDLGTHHIGTVLWKAPELMNGNAKITKMCDIFSFGKILYELVTGKMPSEIKPLDAQKTPLGYRHYEELMLLCLKSNPSQRPLSHSVVKRLNWLCKLAQVGGDEVPKLEFGPFVEEAARDSSVYVSPNCGPDESNLSLLHPQPHMDKAKEDILGMTEAAYNYRARFKDEEVIVKALRPGTDSNLLSQFKQEWDFVSRICHKNLAQFKGQSFNDEQNRCLITESPLRSLYDTLYDRQLELYWFDRISIALDVLNGLDYLIVHKIPHRELQSGCIMIRNNGSAYLTEFWKPDEKIEAIARMTITAGKPGVFHWQYPLPKTRNVEAKATYSFALIMYELLTRRIPYADCKNMDDVRKKYKLGERPELPDIKHWEEMQKSLEISDQREKCRKMEYINLMNQCWHKNITMRPSLDEIREKLTNLNPFVINLADLKLKPQRVTKSTIFASGSQTGFLYHTKYKEKPVTVKALYKGQGIEFLKKECWWKLTYKHKNLVPLLGFSFKEEDNACLLTEVFENGSLYDVLRATTLTWIQRINIAHEVLNGLIFLVENKIPFRELQSPCIMVGKDNGSAHLAEYLKCPGTIPIQYITGSEEPGSFHWEYPSTQEAHEQAEIAAYSFALIMYELLTHRIPYYDCKNESAVHSRHHDGQRPEIPSVRECPAMRGYRERYINLMKSCWDCNAKARPGLQKILSEIFRQKCSSISSEKLSPQASEVEDSIPLYSARFEGKEVTVLRASVSDNDFKSGSILMTHLDHPNIATFFGDFSDSKFYSLVMENWMESLEDILEDKSRPFFEWPQRLTIAVEIAQGLKHLHSQEPSIFYSLKTSSVGITKGDKRVAILWNFCEALRFEGMQSDTKNWNEILSMDICAFGKILLQLMISRTLCERETDQPQDLLSKAEAGKGWPFGFSDLIRRCLNRKTDWESIITDLESMQSYEIDQRNQLGTSYCKLCRILHDFGLCDSMIGMAISLIAPPILSDESWSQELKSEPQAIAAINRSLYLCSLNEGHLSHYSIPCLASPSRFWSLFSPKFFTQPSAIDISENHIYVVDKTTVHVFDITNTAERLRSWELSHLHKFVDLSGNYRGLKVYKKIAYLTVEFNPQIFTLATQKNSVSTPLYGSKFEGNKFGEFTEPRGIAVNKFLYICDSGNHRIQVLKRSTGQYCYQWGFEGKGDSQFLSPYAIQLFPPFIYVGDRVSLQVFTLGGYFLKRVDFKERVLSIRVVESFSTEIERRLYVLSKRRIVTWKVGELLEVESSN